MEATAQIGHLLAPGAEWNIDLNYFPGADTKLRYAVRRDECHFPLDARPAPGALQVLSPALKACGREEEAFLSHKCINAHMMRCLHIALAIYSSFDLGVKYVGGGPVA